MAEIVASLFGVTPDMYRQRQAQLADASALQYAQLTPMQQANYAIARGGYGLAGALGGALGAQDPELQRISARNSIARQIDYNNPESIMRGVNALTQAGDTVGAMQLADIARKMESEMAQRTQRLAAAQASMAQATRERVQATPADIAKAQRIGQIVVALETPELGDAERKALEAELESLRPPKEPKLPSVGGEREAVALEVYNTTFANLTPEQRAAVNKRVQQEQANKTPKVEVKNVMPGDKALADIPAFRKSVQATIDPQLKAITATDQALQAINDSLETGNFSAFRAAQVQFAKAIAGAGDLSQKELKAAGADPSLLGGTADYLSTLFSSTPTADTQKKLRATLQAIRTVAAKQAKAEVDQQRRIALRSPGYSAEAVNEALNFPQLQTQTTAIGADLAAQAAAELARRRGAK